MRKILVCLLCTLLLSCLCGCWAAVLAPNSKAPDNTGDPVQLSTKTPAPKKVSVKILSAYLGNEVLEEEKNLLIVEYEFTNNTNEAESFMLLCKDTLFQNGVECSETIFAEGVESGDTYKDVQPGATFKLKKAYKLNDLTSDVTVKIENRSVFDKQVYLEQTIKISD